jgi:hypothetical protein
MLWFPYLGHNTQHAGNTHLNGFSVGLQYRFFFQFCGRQEVVITHKLIELDLVIRKRNLASFYFLGYLVELRIESGDLDKRKNEIWR